MVYVLRRALPAVPKLAALLTAVAVAVLPLMPAKAASVAQALLVPLAVRFVPLASQCEAPQPTACRPEISLAHGGHVQFFGPPLVSSQPATGARQRIGKASGVSFKQVEGLAPGDRAPPILPTVL